MTTTERVLLSVAVGLALFGLQELLLRLWKRFKNRNDPEGWVTAEEAEQRRQKVREKWFGIMQRQGGELTEAQDTEAMWEDLNAGQVGFVDYKGTKLTITMPLSLGPVDRCVQFEDPLTAALGDLGKVRGGGSFMKEGAEGMEIAEIDIGLVVKDVDRSLPIIREVLKKQGAPKETRILQREPVRRKFPLYE